MPNTVIDTSELDALARRLATAPVRTTAVLLPTTNKAGVVIKSMMAADASGHRRLGGVPASISYEVDVSATGVKLDVGWLHPRGQGHLENIMVFGTSTQPPMMDITRGMRAEAPTFARHLAQAAAKVLL